ncbi:hypothetical protein D3C85_1462520 [compost metagenome]
MEAGDLLFAGVGHGEGLEGAGANREDRTEGIALAEQEFALLQRAAAFDDLVQRVHVLHVQGQRQAKGSQAAILAVGLGYVAYLDDFGHGLFLARQTHNARKVNPGCKPRPEKAYLTYRSRTARGSR